MGLIERRDGRYRDPFGRQRSETFRRKADAERFLREVQVDVERRQWLDPSGADLPLAAWAAEFLLFARRLSPSTQETYKRDLERYILPRFGDYRLGRLPAAEVEHWLNDEIAAGLAPSSVHRHYRTLRRMLQVAVEKEKILSNPCDRVQAPRVSKREMAFLDWSEIVALAEGINERYRALIYLAVDSGMRWSELVGLRRPKVDLRRRKVRVTEQLIRLESGEWLRKETKTAAGVAVHRHLDRDRGDRRRAPPPLLRTRPRRPGFREQGRQPADLVELLAALLPTRPPPRRRPLPVHDLRHTSVALAIAEAAHPKAIQTRMGHSSINVTLDRYGHLFPELDEAIADGFGERLAQALLARTLRPAAHKSEVVQISSRV